MKRYMMSDIHGFLEAFEAALKKTDLSGKNQLILLGDYIDYGRTDGRERSDVSEIPLATFSR